MKKITSLLLMSAILLALVAGCSKDSNDDSRSLLRTVPADASGVAILNIARLVESLDCNTDGKSIKLSDELDKAITESQSLKEEQKKFVKDLCSGETGVAISSVVFFSAAHEYVTGLLNDPEKFISYMQTSGTDLQSNVVEENGAKIVGKTVVIGNQFWRCATGSPDVAQLKYYQGLSEKQSFISQEAAPMLLEGEITLAYIANIKKAMTMTKDAKYIRMATSMMFEDMAYVAGNANIKKKDFNSTTRVLNSDMKPAKLLLPAKKIDASLVKSLNKTGDVFMAICITEDLSKKVADAVSSAFGPSIKNITQPLEQIDGTVAICTDLDGTVVDARIQTTGKDFTGLSNMLHLIPAVDVTRDGDVISVKYGNAVSSGTMTSEQAAAKLKGAWLGFAAADIPAKGMNTKALLIPDGNSIRLDVNVEGGTDALMIAMLK